jgi:uncharacterized short protein YbdD (DUF466 family)
LRQAAKAGRRRLGQAAGAAVAFLPRCAKAVRWYVRELMGDSAYERYLARFRLGQACSDGAEPLTEREFWRRRSDAQETEARCC